MFVLVTYDVNTEKAAGRKRLRQVAKVCQNYGHRVQNSVFECVVQEADFVVLKATIQSIIDAQTDSVRFYFLGKNWDRHIEHIGVQTAINVTGNLIV